MAMKNPFAGFDRAKFRRLASYASLFGASFLFFLYLTFPYEVLKESISSTVTKSTGWSLRMDSLSPKLPLGVYAGGVTIQTGSRGELKLGDVTIRLNILPLFIGRVSADLNVRSPDGGRLDTRVSLSLIKMITAPKTLDPVSAGLVFVGVTGERFNIGPIADFGLGAVAGGPSMNPLLAPVLQQMAVSGKMNLRLALNPNMREVERSSGSIDFALTESAIRFSDAGLGLPDQSFSKAQIRAKLDAGTLTFDDRSGFTASDLDIGVKGKIMMRPVMSATGLELAVGIRLDKQLKSQFGFLLDAMTGGTGSGAMNMQIRGALSAPAISYL